MPNPSKIFILITGLPGSGKTEMARRIVEGVEYPDVLVRGRPPVSDWFYRMKSSIGLVDDPKSIDELYAVADVKDVVVIADPKLGQDQNMMLAVSLLATRYPVPLIHVLAFRPDLELCKENCRRRIMAGGHVVEPGEINRLYTTYRPANYICPTEKVFSSHVTVTSIDPYRSPYPETPEVESIKEKAKKWGVELSKIDGRGPKYDSPCFVYVRWDGGGASGGSCWEDGEARPYDGDSEPEFSAVDRIVIRLCPDIDEAELKLIRSKVIRERSVDVNEYYGNYHIECMKYADVRDIIAELKHYGLI